MNTGFPSTQGAASTLPENYGALLGKLEQKEKRAEQTHTRRPVPKSYFKQLRVRDNYDDFEFRCHDFARLMGGIPKPLTENQQDTYEAYHDRYMGIGRPLTEKQERTYFDLGRKMRAEITLSDAAKKYCEELIREDETGRRKLIETKYMDKGLEREDASINLYGDFIGQELKKNEGRKSNGFWNGECDQITPLDIVRDFKTSWDHTTFPMAAIEISNPMYEWQLQDYMDLWNVDRAELVYCLVDTPLRLVEDEIRRMDWKHDLLSVSGDVREEHIPFIIEKVSNMIYTLEGLYEVCEQSSLLDISWFDGVFVELPIEKRIKVFTLERNEKMIAQGKEMVKLARAYMNRVIAELRNGK